jgi:hypothetical protein
MIIRSIDNRVQLSSSLNTLVAFRLTQNILFGGGGWGARSVVLYCFIKHVSKGGLVQRVSVLE